LSDEENKMAKLEITSGSFVHNGMIPIRHTCDGQDISPELFWSGIPIGTKSLVLIVDDPDAPDPANPKMTWVHWVLYNISPDIDKLSENASVIGMPLGILEGINDWQRTGYGGPCPPIGTHRYFHKLYAIDIVLSDLQRPTKEILEEKIEGHIIEYSELIGLYHRS
tara:strand:+ start:5414 stop:5911 length:498 start_codon:yes stop_codon:yes gene_type:complete